MEDLWSLWLKLQGSIEAMATSVGSMNERLYHAWLDHLTGLQPDQFPGDLADRFAALHHAATGWFREPGPTNVHPATLRTTIESMTEVEAKEVADRVVDFATRVRAKL